MRKKIAFTLLVAILLTMSMAMLCACVDEDPKPRQVELELVNPITGDTIEYGDTIDWPEEKTYIDVRIRDMETGEYLNDFDFPGNSIRGSYRTEFILLSDDGKVTIPLDTDGYWPSLDKINSYAHFYNTFRIKIHFDCKPKDIKDTDFQRKYATRSDIIDFYRNK